MKNKPTDNKLYFTKGVASTMKEGEKIPVNFIYYNDPSCGYYLDPRGFIVLPNFNSTNGTSEDYGLYIKDGEIIVDELNTVITTINNYCKTKTTPASGASFKNCPGSQLKVEDTYQLNAIVSPQGALQAGSWTSSSPAVATVSNSGLVTALTVGTTTITFKSTDGEFTATCVITVISKE